MALSVMYEGKNNSPQTDITSAITAADQIIPVTDISVFPDAPNLATIGNDENAEVIRYNGIDGSTLTGCERGFGGTTAKQWESATVISRQITKYDLDTIRGNILDLESRKQDNLTFDTAPTAGSANPVTSGGIKTALDGKQATLQWDTTPTDGSTKPVTSDGIYEALTEKVAKAGDTMTGDLIIKNTDLDNTDQSRTANTTRNLYFREKNNKDTAYIANTMGTSGSITTGIYVTRQNGNNSESNYVWLQITKDFEKNIVVSHPAAWRTGLNIADMGIVEDSNTAKHAISAGQYVIWKGKLYTANSAIAVGTTLSTSNLTERANGGLNHLSSDIFDFKRYRTLTSASDLNNLGQVDSSGVYYLQGATASGNAPVSYGMLFNLRISSDTIFQFIVGMDGCYYRYKGGSPISSWRSWYKLTGTAV